MSGWEIHELEQLRRSIAMLSSGAPALRREEAYELVSRLGEVTRQLKRLQEGLRQLLEDSEGLASG